MQQDPKQVIKRLKHSTKSITNDVAYMMQHIRLFSITTPTHPEIEDRYDKDSVKEIQMQETVVRLAELVMEMRKELILIGVSYEEETTGPN